MTSFHLLLHLGYFVTGEIGDGALRGNFELFVEPTLIYLDASNSATVLLPWGTPDIGRRAGHCRTC